MRTLKAVPLHKIYGDWGYGEPALFPLVHVISTHVNAACRYADYGRITWKHTFEESYALIIGGRNAG